MNCNFKLASSYKAARIDTSTEPVPENRVFSSIENESFVYDPQKPVSYSKVMYSIQQRYIDDFALKVLSLIATFGSVCTTSKALKTLLYMNGEDLGTNDRKFLSAIHRLFCNSLITTGRFVSPNKKNPSAVKIICLTGNGSRIAQSMGVVHRFNPLEVVDVTTLKTRAQTCMLITNFLKNIVDDISFFEPRPIITNKEYHPDAIVRPSCMINMYGEDVYFEVVRSGHADYCTALADKLHRYTLVFPDAHPNVVINGEDTEMNRKIFSYLKENTDHGFDVSNIMFTDDIAQFGASFKNCLYSFAEDGSKIYFEFFDSKAA